LQPRLQGQRLRLPQLRSGGNNLRLEMRRLDLVKELNLLVTGEAVLGHDMTE
jgi:hypothetical protein